MQYASKLLLNSSYSIDQIAHECGYQNLSFFYKNLKKPIIVYQKNIVTETKKIENSEVNFKISIFLILLTNF